MAQTADLFHNLHLHWPESWKRFIEEFASVFNFAIPHWLSFVDPQCSFELTYLQKWSLMMGSPLIVVVTMVAYVLFKLAMKRLARNTLQHSLWARNAIESLTRGSTDEMQSFADAIPEPEPELGPAGIEPNPEPEPESPSEQPSLRERLLQSRPASPSGIPNSSDDEVEVSDQPIVLVAPSGASSPTTTWRNFCKKPCKRMWCGPKWWIKQLHTAAEFELDKTLRKLKTICLGMLMLGYVVLVQYALAPLGCQDLYGKRFMTTHASIEVRSADCGTKTMRAQPQPFGVFLTIEFACSATGVRQEQLS